MPGAKEMGGAIQFPICEVQGVDFAIVVSTSPSLIEMGGGIHLLIWFLNVLRVMPLILLFCILLWFFSFSIKQKPLTNCFISQSSPTTLFVFQILLIRTQSELSRKDGFSFDCFINIKNIKDSELKVCCFKTFEPLKCLLF